MNITYSRKAAAELGDMPTIDRARIVEKMRFFAKHDDPLALAKRLVGVNIYRFRIGDYRALFVIDNGIIHVITIKRRDAAYRKIGLD